MEEKFRCAAMMEDLTTNPKPRPNPKIMMEVMMDRLHGVGAMCEACVYLEDPPVQSSPNLSF